MNPQPPEPGPQGPWTNPQTDTPGAWTATGSGIPALPPIAGYEVPPHQQPGYDPLISADYSGWWQRGTAIVRAGWKPLAGLQLIGLAVQVIVQVPLLVFVAVQSNDLARQAQDRSDTAPPDLGPILAAGGLSLLVTFAAVVVSAAVAVASMYVGVSIATLGSARVGPALGVALRRAFPLIGWQLLGGLITLVGLCLCILPGLYPIAVFTVLPAVVAFERTNAVGRCFALFHRSFGAAAGRVATILGFSIAGAIVGAIIAQVVAAAAGAPGGLGLQPVATSASMGTIVLGTAVSTIVSVTITQGVAVLTGPLTLTAYADLRARFEPLTTQTLVNEIGAVPS